MTGNKLVFMVTDPSKFSVQGDGLGPMIRVNQTATFNISAPCAQIEDLGVSISGLVLATTYLMSIRGFVIYGHSKKYGAHAVFLH